MSTTFVVSMLMVYQPGAKCLSPVSNANGTWMVPPTLWSCACKDGAIETTARRAVKTVARNFQIEGVFMAVLLLEGVSTAAFTY
jgi:hypothetical protein